MPPLRSRTVTHGRNMAGARALLRATGAMATSGSTGAVRDISQLGGDAEGSPIGSGPLGSGALGAGPAGSGPLGG